MTLSQFTAQIFNIALEEEGADDIEDIRWLVGDDAYIEQAYADRYEGMTAQDYINEQRDLLND